MHAREPSPRCGCHGRVSLLAVALVCIAASSAGAQSPPVVEPSAVTPVTDAMLQDPAPEDWLMWRRTLDGWG
ncbi:MAG: hypothetical protein OXH69_18180, partial [Acidobacteria bacterium]|nr:hypothetical protein [Acidobacteriota bacterium]